MKDDFERCWDWWKKIQNWRPIELSIDPIFFFLYSLFRPFKSFHFWTEPINAGPKKQISFIASNRIYLGVQNMYLIIFSYVFFFRSLNVELSNFGQQVCKNVCQRRQDKRDQILVIMIFMVMIWWSSIDSELESR